MAVFCQKMLTAVRDELSSAFSSFESMIDKMQVHSQGLSSDRATVFSDAPPQGVESEVQRQGLPILPR